MTTTSVLCTTTVRIVAKYNPQRLPHFKGNPLIEALPLAPTADTVGQLLQASPEFDVEQRDWPKHDRISMLLEMQKFRYPLSMHVELALTLDSMIRNGYVGRAPMTPEHIQRFQANYEKQKAGVLLSAKWNSSTARLSTLLMGLPGMGKTRTVEGLLENYPSVIFHPEYNVYQVPYLYVQMPSDGMSIKGMAHAILNRLDALIPGADYFNTYALKGRVGADALMRSIARVMNAHFVGCLIADEVQNLTNAHKGKQTVMTELVSACNDLGVPILFIGTNKATEVFSLDFRQSRRAVGHAIRPWDRLHHTPGEGAKNKWTEFVRAMWKFQWVRVPVDPHEHLIDALYHYSQGILDIAVKLFAAAQMRAIYDGTEKITADLLADVYRSDMSLIHKMIDALRDNDVEALAQLPDIKPIDLEGMNEAFGRKVRYGDSEAFSVRPDSPTFVPRIATSLAAAGSNEQDAMHIAKEVAASGRAKNLHEGLKEAVKLRSKLKPVPRPKAKKKEGQEESRAAGEDPADYRHAIDRANANGTTNFEELIAMGAARPLEDLLPLH